MGWLRTLWSIRSTLILVLTPLLLLPLPLLYPDKASRCAYAIIIMAVYWMTEVIPMAATALLPIVLMPWLGVLGSKDICVNYLKDTNMLFFGGLLVAVAVERWNLHRRLALRVLMVVGSQPKWLMFGFMATTAFLSMWMNNTATTAMMIPIVHAVLTELKQHLCPPEDADDREEPDFITGDKKTIELVVVATPDRVPGEDETLVANGNAKEFPSSVSGSDEVSSLGTKSERKFENLSKGMALCVAYAANIGGTATLTGTAPNLVLKGQLDTLFGAGTGINFSSWFIFAFPNMLISLLLAWLWLQMVFLGTKTLFSCFFRRSVRNTDSANDVIRKEYEKLGDWSFAEIAVLVHFVILALLWLTRQPEFVPGWSDIPIFVDGYVTDACVAITISMSLFMFPSRRPNFLCFRKKGDYTEPTPAPGLLDWETVHKKMTWSVIFLLGGGFALADACKSSGLSEIIGDTFSYFKDYPPWALVFIVCFITLVFTQITSNTATATILMPVLAQLSAVVGIHPLYLMIPVTITTSLAFMLPVSTPPNAIVFAYCKMKIYDMAKAGLAMNIICLLVLQLAINTWGVAYFHLDTLPPWMPQTNGVNATVNATLNATIAPVVNSTIL